MQMMNERPSTTVIEPTSGWINLRPLSIWKYHELLYFFVWRDVKVRYKQTLLGIAWVIVQPLANMLIFSGLFGVLLNVPTGGIPYPLFVLSGLLPWQYFSSSLTKAANSLVDNTNLITKIYFPRIFIPFSAVLSSLVDFFISAILLSFLIISYHLPITSALYYLPLFLLIAILTAFGFGLWLSALNVRYRDIKHLMPFLIQVWMYLTPVVYGTDLIPEKYRWMLSLNPMTGVIDGFRWSLLGSKWLNSKETILYFVISLAISLVTLLSGMAYFRKTEQTFADVI